MEQIEWVLKPKKATQEMCAAAVIFANGASVYETVAEDALKIEESIYGESYAAMIAAAPKPPHITMTQEEAQNLQNWKGMDGAVAYHLIDRHASGWDDTARMMEAWRKANSGVIDKQDQRTHRALLARCLSVIETLEGEDSTESEMLAELKDEIRQAIGLTPVVPGSLL